MDYYREFQHVLVQRARSLRRRQTRAEAVLWQRVRNRRVGGFKFRRQHVIKNKIVDFYCHQARLVIEVDGEVHSGEEAQERDRIRDLHLNLLGFRVIRFTNRRVLNDTDAVCAEILRVCRYRHTMNSVTGE
jgi:very-short-patch-repair endonuclease